MIVERKIWPEYFSAIKAGRKSFEIRLADFEINEGDILLLREWDPLTREYTGRELKKKVTYIMRTKEMAFFTQDEIDKYGYQIMSLKDPDEKDLEVKPA